MSFTEDLTWITADGEDWVAETRTHRFHGVDAARGLWVLDFSTTLRNVSGRDLEFGSPTTQGRPNAGYTGFVIRMPRAWTGGRVLAGGLPDDAGADAVMGLDAPWVAVSGEHDEYDGGGTVLAFAGSLDRRPRDPVVRAQRAVPDPRALPLVRRAHRARTGGRPLAGAPARLRRPHLDPGGDAGPRGRARALTTVAPAGALDRWPRSLNGLPPGSGRVRSGSGRPVEATPDRSTAAPQEVESFQPPVEGRLTCRGTRPEGRPASSRVSAVTSRSARTGRSHADGPAASTYDPGWTRSAPACSQSSSAPGEAHVVVPHREPARAANSSSTSRASPGASRTRRYATSRRCGVGIASSSSGSAYSCTSSSASRSPVLRTRTHRVHDGVVGARLESGVPVRRGRAPRPRRS